MKTSTRNLAAIAVIAIAVTAGIVVSAYLLSRFMVKIQHTTENTITVKGVAEKMVRSDVATFYCSVTVKAAAVDAGYAAIGKASDALRSKLENLGFTASVREDESLNYDEVTRTVKTKDNGKETATEVFDHYRFVYGVRVRTADVTQVARNVLKIYELAAQKLDVSVSAPEYYISNPEQYKLALVDEASAAATQRAQVVAAKCGSRLGNLLTARQGVIQITRPASNDTSDYGVYDTSSVEKVMRLVMTLDFALK